jgi:hypothetical protein
MKKQILLAIATLFTISAFSQKIDTVKSAVIVEQVVYNAVQKDTLQQFTISVFDLKVNDTTQGCNTYVVFYTRTARQIGAANVPIPASVVNKWSADDRIIEDYILNILNLKRK